MPSWNFTRLDLNITYRCTVRCTNCNRFCGALPGDTSSDMTTGQVGETLASDSPWRRIKIVGGEPTLHPAFREIVTMVARFSGHRKNLRLSLLTNGWEPHTVSNIRWTRRTFPQITILNSFKYGPVQRHFPVGDAPIDTPGAGFHIGCSVSRYCGLGRDYHGYYCCSIAAAIDRFFGWNSAISDIAGLGPSAMRRMLDKFCPLCGYSRPEIDPYGIAPPAATTTFSASYRQRLADLGY